MQSRVVAVAAAILMSTSVGACSLLYASYDRRFGEPAGDAGAPAFVEEDAAIRLLAVTESSLYYAVGAEIRRAPRGGGPSSVFWAGDAAGDPTAAVSALASDGVSALIWTFHTGAASAVLVAEQEDPASVRAVDAGRSAGRAVAADTSLFAWAAATGATCAGACPLVEGLDRTLGTERTFSFVVPDAGTRAGIGARAFALDAKGIAVIVSDTTFMRILRADGATVCRKPGFVTNGAVGGVAQGTAGDPVYVLLGGPTETSGGPILRYDTPCPTSADAGALVATSAVLLVEGDDAVYWATDTGEIWSARYDGDASARLGAAASGANAIAAAGAYVYVASANAIYRFSK